ncbi:MAG: HlyD family efflux transporter periplasmic adaptor subunit [Gammaproteobacteria bacterium]
MLNRLRNHPVITSIVVVIIALLVWGFWPKPVWVETVVVKRAPMTVSIEEEGRTRVIDHYVISAPVDGTTCRTQLEVGDSVDAEQTLLNIRPLESKVLDARSRAQAEARVAAARSALQSAKEQASAATAAQQLASKELERLRPLSAKGVISKGEYDKAVTEANTKAAAKRSADFNVDVANYELEAAKSVLDYARTGTADSKQVVPVRSPITGRILKISHECEGPVRTGDPLLEVGDPTRLEIEVDVLSADAVKIKPGMKVLFDRWGGEKPLQGVVRTVEPVAFTKVSALGVEEQRVLIICDFTSPQELWQRLGDGYRVEAKFVLWQEDNVLQVPASSLFRYEDGWAIFVVENDRAQRRVVKVGQRNGMIAQVLEGIEEGEKVINHPNDDVKDNGRAKIR